MDVSPADIKLILATLQDSEFDQAEVVIGDVRIAVARNGKALEAAPTAEAVKSPVVAPAVVPAPAPAASAAPTATVSSAAAASAAAAAPSESAHTVESPSVGVFWRASAPGAAPFVEVGQEVAASDTIGIVEVMKLMNNIVAGVDGVVTAIHVENAGSVEFGTPLVTIEPKA
ncbi:acetyl-CoA carboxylase biotin carboxyl carrier protein [Rhodococcus rhodochrous]|uniref:acetyl-CoA carboxylase biotin carboxyl carrier protein n=1 Tax=Rhodococcus rhodochrous TaxID=1829 RepID=UPI001E2DFA59|nr:acetyl-CoA carboxylase biotin carboxyl carrier protein [Rhodococcus rhodochrous]MCD2100329.1 acetyl-CoA carboxylase biotin carboxyl carrier protein [Rhodococcus rhodochrous]MCD2124676.1 acetyl-CoA carboxylase biotin carboxyl carrier protein [Rhodococcus rhodochrous]MCQ4137987.1 acetyl-CoA carboxylase biotin carboxyl carrier protein [Rhodococcus rhodochrous]MDJ0021541.1 acetyl-CoA carboxylase biotin carboxyl carrier protein [Rhodococcus rhodochrous]